MGGHRDHGHAHHDHAHGHHHHGSGDEGALAGALVLNGGFLVVEAGVGLATGSLALMSDAAHMLGDVGALVIALVAARVAQGARAPARTFGLARAEVLGGFVNALLMLLAVAWIAAEAMHRLAGPPPEVPGMPILVVGAIGLAINVGSMLWLMRGDRGNANVRGAILHMGADALGSVGALVAAGLVLAGFPAADTAVSLLVAGLVLATTWPLLRDTARVLMELPPSDVDVAEVQSALSAQPGVRSVHDVHVWTVDGRAPLLTAHLVVEPEADPDAIRRDAVQLLAERWALGHSTLQLERSGGGGCFDSGCGVRAGDD